jgi:hypothetical protein
VWSGEPRARAPYELAIRGPQDTNGESLSN